MHRSSFRLSFSIRHALLAVLALCAHAVAQNQSAPENGTGNPDTQDEQNRDKPAGTGEETEGDPVETSTGAFAFSKKLFEFPGRESPLSISLGYVSNCQGIETQTGARWTHDYEERLMVQYTLGNPIEPYPGPADVAGYFPHGEEGSGISGGSQEGAGPTWDPIPLRPLYIDVYHFHDLRVDYYRSAVGDPTTWIPTSGQATKLRSQNVQSGPYSLPHSFVLRYPDGTKTFFPHALWEGGCGIYTFRAGITQDSNGNTVTRAYDTLPKFSGCPGGEGQFFRRLSSVTDNYGRVIEFNYDATGWLHEITDFTGRKAVIEHDTIGNVTAIELPTVATLGSLPGLTGYTARTEIEYTPMLSGYPHSKHNIARVFAATEVLAGGPGKVPYVVNTWDPTGERVASQVVGGTNASGIPAGGKHIFRLEIHGQPIQYGWFDCARRALIVDPDGKAELHLFDSSFRPRLVYQFTGYLDPDAVEGLPIDALVACSPGTPSVADGLSATYSLPASGSSDPPIGCHWTRRDYDAATNQVVLELTQDSRTEYVYDSGSPDVFQKGNLLLVERIANDGSGAKLQRAYTYDPLYNRLRREYDPRAFGGYVPPNGGTYTPERYALTNYFDYQEGQQATLQGEIDYWTIDVAQGSSSAVLASRGLTVDAIDFGTDLNGNGVIDGLGGNVVRAERTVRLFDDPSVPTFRTLTEIERYQYNAFGLPTRRIDPAGYRTDYAYYVAGTSPKHPDSDPSSEAEGGFLAAITGYAGQGSAQPSTVRLGYDAVGRNALIRDARGFDLSLTHDELDRVVSTTDALGHERGSYHDPNGNLVHEYWIHVAPSMDPATGEPSGASSSPRHVVNTMTYDMLDHVVSREVQNDPQGGTSVVGYRYTKAGVRVLTLYPEWSSDSGNAKCSFFDEFDRPWTTTQGGLTAQFASHLSTAAIPERSLIPVDVPDVTATTRTFYALSERVRIEDEEGRATRFEYDAFNRLVEILEPLGHYVRSVLDVAGRETVSERYEVGSGSDKLLSRVSTSYDERGQAFETRSDHFGHDGAPIDDGVATARQAFDIRGLPVMHVDDRGDVSTEEYDGLRRQTRTQDAAGNYSVMAYDAAGNQIHVAVHELESDDPSIEHVQRAWAFHDALNRVSARVDELGHATRHLYDSAGREVFQSDARAAVVDVPLASLDSITQPQHGDLSAGPMVNRHGNTVWFEYDDQDYLLTTRRHQRIDGLGGNPLLYGGQAEIVSSREYDGNGRLVAETDDRGNPTTHEYDSLNRVEQTRYANQTLLTREYYKTGHLERTVDPNGTVVQYQYDASNRLTWELVTPGFDVRGALYAEFQYDGANRLTLSRNAVATVTREYDSLSQLSAETLDGQRTEIRRDATGKLTGYTYPGGRTLAVEVDAIGRMRSISDDGSSVPLSRWEYRGEDACKTQAFENGVVGTMLYDAIWRPTSRVFELGATPLEHRTFAWDRQGNKASRTDQLQSTARVFTYLYDSAARLVKSIQSGGGQPNQSTTYRLDDLANRKLVIGGSHPGTYTMNSSDLPVNAYTTTPFDVRTYDTNGNVRSTSATVTLYYDYRDRLVEYHDLKGAGRHHYYTYDALGRRVGKVTDAGRRTQQVVKFYYDGGLRICEERDGTAALLATYVNGPRVDDVVSMRRDVDGDGSPEDYYFHADDMGNVHSMTDAAGVVVENYEYRDYGQVVSPQTQAPLTSSNVWNTRLFTGRELDWETGLYHYRHRQYDPLAGRFLSRDPLGVWGDAANLGNAYTYAASNPWTVLDPLGLEGEDVMGDCRTSTSDPEGVKGDTEHHGSVSGKEGKSGERLSDAEYQKQKKIAKANEFKKQWQEKLDRIKKDVETIKGDPKHLGTPIDVDVEVTEDGDLKVTMKKNGQTTTETYDPNNGAQMKAVGEFIDRVDGHNQGIVYTEKIRKEIMTLGLGTAAGSVASKAAKLLGAGDKIASAKSIEKLLSGLKDGKSPGVKLVGSADDLAKTFKEMSAGGKAVQGSTYPGTQVKLPDGTLVSMRGASKSGGPTVDINFGNGKNMKIHVGQ